MKLHWSPRSPFVRKVMIVAHERGLIDRLNCVRTVVAMTTPHAELMRDNPLSKIPALVLDDGTALYDSPVICEYLDALDGKPQLFPLDRKRRILALRRQALGDGFLDLLVLARNERLREAHSQLHLTNAAVRSAAVLASLEREADALAASASASRSKLSSTAVLRTAALLKWISEGCSRSRSLRASTNRSRKPSPSAWRRSARMRCWRSSGNNCGLPSSASRYSQITGES